MKLQHIQKLDAYIGSHERMKYDSFIQHLIAKGSLSKAQYNNLVLWANYWFKSDRYYKEYTVASEPFYLKYHQQRRLREWWSNGRTNSKLMSVHMNKSGTGGTLKKGNKIIYTFKIMLPHECEKIFKDDKECMECLSDRDLTKIGLVYKRVNKKPVLVKNTMIPFFLEDIPVWMLEDGEVIDLEIFND